MHAYLGFLGIGASWVGLICFLWWIGNYIYLVFTSGISSISFTTFDIVFVLGSMFVAVIFGLNSYAHGRLTPVIDGILSLIFYACTFYAIYNYGIVSGLALYYIMIEVVGYIQRR